jgi:methylamine dehydrogenase heavy chain
MRRVLAIAPLLAAALLTGCGSGEEQASPVTPAPTPAAPLPVAAAPNPELPPLPVEKMGSVRTLPVPYPPHWVFVHDGSFFHMNDGKVVLLDADAGTQPAQYKGMINNAFMGQFAFSATRRELYVAETFFARGQRGQRTDVLTVYDQATLAPVGEVVLPGARRFSGMPEKHGLQLIDGDRLALVFNLNPATSVSVVDLDSRQLLSQIDIPGCALIYPTGPRGFSALCGDGAMLSTQLDAAGQVAAQTRTGPVWDVDEDPLFEKPAIVDGVAYFPTFHGQVLPVDLRGPVAQPGKAWSLLSEAERSEGWRPGGWQLVDTDAGGRLYVLFHPEGADGTHNGPGTEVWVFDPKRGVRERRIALATPALSLMLTRDEAPLLVTTNAVMALDVYEAQSGKHLRTLTAFGQETPFVVYPAN